VKQDLAAFSQALPLPSPMSNLVLAKTVWVLSAGNTCKMVHVL